MFRKSTTEISGQIYEHYKLLLRFLRVIGLFPVRVRKKKSKLFFELSPLLLSCGFVFGAFAIFMAYWGIFLDIGINKEDSIRITSDTDKLMILVDITMYSAVFFCGIVLTPCKFRSFFSYVRDTSEVDSIIKTAYKKSEKYKLLLAVAAIVILNAVLGWTDLSDCYKILGDKIGVGGVLYRYMGMDGVAFMTNVVEYTNKILTNGLEKRITRLNELLKVELAELENAQLIFSRRDEPARLFKRPRCSEANRTRTNNQTAKAWSRFDQTEKVIKLSIAYQSIMDAADALNELFGICTAVKVVAILWGLIESSYFFLLALTGRRGELRDAIEIPGALAVISFHLFRMLLITEPAYSCLVQIGTTKALVCNLLSCKMGPNLRKQAMRLAMILELRTLEFSACGLFTVDRVLFTSLLDTIVTLLVILLQYRDAIAIDL